MMPFILKGFGLCGDLRRHCKNNIFAQTEHNLRGRRAVFGYSRFPVIQLQPICRLRSGRTPKQDTVFVHACFAR